MTPIPAAPTCGDYARPCAESDDDESGRLAWPRICVVFDTFRLRIDLRRGDALNDAWSGQLDGPVARLTANGGRRFERHSPHRRRALGPLVATVLAACLPWSAGGAHARDRLIHAEDFSVASTYDPSFWIAETGFFRNKEAQYYRPANVSVRDGALTLEARREPAPNDAYDPDGADWRTTTKSADYTSGSLVSRDAYTYGVFEVVARLPQGAGTWPAIWTIDEWSGPYREIDIVEAVGKTPGKVSSTVYAGRDIASVESLGVGNANA